MSEQQPMPDTEYANNDTVLPKKWIASRIAPTRLRSRSRRAESLLPSQHLPLVHRFLQALKVSEKSFFFADEIERNLAEFLSTTSGGDPEASKAVKRFFRGCPEIILDADYAYAVIRPKTGVKYILRFHPEYDHLEEIDHAQYLEVKDAFIQGRDEASKHGLVLDFTPYFQNFPKVNNPDEMGGGISFLNRHLSGQMYRDPGVFRHALLQFMRDCHLDGQSLLVNEHLDTPERLVDEIDAAKELLAEQPRDTPYHELSHDLRVHGFEAGWGATGAEIARNLAALAAVVESSDSARFEAFLGRLPLVKSVLMVSPHGWFAQDNVLGRPDTGGQVTYVLDQTRAIERELQQRFADCGIDTQPRIIILTRLIPHAEDTTCNVPREKVHGTDDCWIVRVPFRDERGEVISQWISRFQLWPYLESFAEEARHVVVTELMGKPDLIVGHYSDGNLVAHRLAEELDTTHCAAVHALEKTKYLLSDLHWADMEPEYRFSLQFTADLIAYNSADYIISSSYREIGGTDTEMGMFESYETFSMPGLYRVVSGMDPRLARHNIVPPGPNDEYFFPHTDGDRRVEAVTQHLRTLIGPEPLPGDVGQLRNPQLPCVFSMARIDKIKNLSGLIEIFGRHASLRQVANLFIVSSLTDASNSTDQEEIEEVGKMHDLIRRYELEGSIRWCARRLDRVETGEIYRLVADGGGIFAQPAFMETFGLTVVEAMACGTPVVVTCFGGPSEIVIDGRSGAVRNPTNHQAFGDALHQVLTDEAVWRNYSTGGMQRVRDAFSWSSHARRIVRLANVYSYWNYMDVMNRQALDGYIHMLYHTVYRPRAEAMKEEH
jgi:sucrose synthase